MKHEVSEKLLVEELFKKSIQKNLLPNQCSGQKVEVEKMTGDASTRRYYRVQCTSLSYVVCLDEPLKDRDVEPNFVKLQRVLSGAGVRVPKIFDKDLSLGYLLEEDLGDQTFIKELSQIKTPEVEYGHYEKALRLMIDIHKIDLTPHKVNKEIFCQLAFDTEKLYQEMEFTKKFFLYRLLGISENDQRVEVLYGQLHDLCSKISKEPMVLVHRDYHSRNLMLKDGEQVVIDFQDARMGSPIYDLVSILEDSYYDITEQNRTRLKEYYFHSFFQQYSAKDFKHFEYVYDLFCIQRVYKAIGSFSYIYADRKDIRYLKHIGFAFEKLRKTLMKHSEYDEARKILSQLYYFH